ncbi:ATP-binding cassette superfamily, partial [Micromonas pusilla CCMP1545]
WLLAGVVALTLGTTAISVGFNFLGRDFYNSIAEKKPDDFDRLLKTYIAAIAGAIPVFVLRDYYQEVLVLKWRGWMTERYVEKYLDKRNFYHIQTGSVIDNPDQRIVDDIASFTSTSLGLTFTLLNAGIDLVSFSGILFGIYKPLVAVLFVYAAGGTVVSAKLGKPLVGLNFTQEAREADFRYGLVRVRENAESIAFYAGEAAERSALVGRLRRTLDNFGDLLVATRNVDFFTSCYRFLIQFLPAAVVAPLFFKGEIEFGVINQSSSAFSHILGDVSLVVYQIERLASFSAVTDRLGQMTEVLDIGAAEMVSAPGEIGKRRITRTPVVRPPLVEGLDYELPKRGSVLVMGPSGAGKTSLLRAVAGLWEQGDGEATTSTAASIAENNGMYFVPQRPYLVLGTLRQQLLYPTWGCPPEPSDDELRAALDRVNLGYLLTRGANNNGAGAGDDVGENVGLDATGDWASILSLGEQQRLAFARLLLTAPPVALLDEATSALDGDNEAKMYRLLRELPDTAYVSVGHRASLLGFHDEVLRLGGDASW